MKQYDEKVGRNDACPCGSGKKYKKCCIGKDGSPEINLSHLYYKRYKVRLKQPEEIEGIRRAGRLVVDTLDMAAREIRPGMKTDEINTLVHDFTIRHNARPAPLHYKGFPKSVCTSVNEVICHGIPGERRLMEGDIINIDVTSILDGFYADANQTFFVGTPGEDARKIVTVARESLKKALLMVMPGNTIGDIGWAIQQYAEGQGCSVVREFVGHGIGRNFHEAPQIPHFGKRGEGIKLVPGMVFTVEPMINLGSARLKILADNWTAVSADHSLSAQFEQTILVTDDAYESLTPFDL